jgi:hypothetical protein
MALSIRIKEMKPVAPGQTMVTVEVESRTLTRFLVHITVIDPGAKAETLANARKQLQSFCDDLWKALRRSEWYDELQV